MDHRAGGRASHYDPRIARLVLEGIFAGRTVKQIATDPELPAYCTIYHWARMHPEFGWRWEGAREQLAWEKVQGVASREQARRFRQAKKLVAGGKRWWKAGRRSTYTVAAARAFCARVRRGQRITAICARPDMPSQKAIYGWLKREPEFREMYVAARDAWLLGLQAQADAVAEGALDPAITPEGFRAIKQRVWKIESRIGRRRAKTWRGESTWRYDPAKSGASITVIWPRDRSADASPPAGAGED